MDGVGMMKFSDPSNFFNNLGDGLLVEILGRLPSKAAIRLKSVCKRWRSLVSSNYFITFFNHRRHDPSLPPLDDHDSLSYGIVLQFAAYSEHDFCSSLVRCRYTHNNNASKLYAHHRIDLSFLPCPQTKVELKASCDDLVVCSFKKTFLYVCNLLTKQWVALPPAPHFREQAIGLLCVPVPTPCSICHRQCVHNSHYKFMVVRIHRHDQHEVPQSKFKVQLFSSEEGEWTTRVVSSPRALESCSYNSCYGSHYLKSYSFLVAHKGMLHWQTSNCVVVFDPFNSPETFSHAIDLPELGSNCPSSIAVCRDRVCVETWFFPQLRDGRTPRRDIWQLEDYMMGKWSLVHKHYMKDLKPVPGASIAAVQYVHPDGNVLYERNDRTLWLCNFQCGEMDQQYELLQRKRLGGDLLFNGNILQIVDQWWPTPLPSLT